MTSGERRHIWGVPPLSRVAVLPLPFVFGCLEHPTLLGREGLAVRGVVEHFVRLLWADLARGLSLCHLAPRLVVSRELGRRGALVARWLPPPPRELEGGSLVRGNDTTCGVGYSS